MTLGREYYVGDFLPTNPWVPGYWPPNVFSPVTSTITMFETPWVCPKCGVKQIPSEVRTIEIVEPGKNPRVEFDGRIRPEGSQDGPPSYTCLVCGHIWGDWPEDPTPGGASITFLHPITEQSSCCVSGCAMCDRDAC